MHRLALDHPERVRRMMLLDIAPTLFMYEKTDMRFVSREQGADCAEGPSAIRARSADAARLLPFTSFRSSCSFSTPTGL